MYNPFCKLIHSLIWKLSTAGLLCASTLLGVGDPGMAVPVSWNSRHRGEGRGSSDQYTNTSSATWVSAKKKRCLVPRRQGTEEACEGRLQNVEGVVRFQVILFPHVPFPFDGLYVLGFWYRHALQLSKLKHTNKTQMKRGVRNHGSKGDSTPGEEGRTHKKLPTVFAPAKGTRGLRWERASPLAGHPLNLLNVRVCFLKMIIK